MHGQMYPTTQCALFSKRKCHFDRLLQIIRDFTTFLFNGNDNGAQRAQRKVVYKSNQEKSLSI